MAKKAKKAKKASKARKPAKKPARTAAASAGAAFSLKNQFLHSFQQEHATTMKVLRAFPAEQSEFRPHPRSVCARELAFNFVLEQAILASALTNTLDLSRGFPKAPSDFRGIVDQFDKDFHGLVELIKQTSEKDFHTTVKFLTGPKQMGDVPKIMLAWFILSDQIHHRGQYSVYLRMAGGKVPSIYGPSADEPWM
jgi:uncharacterized damage-inducible protein DinB